MGIFSGLFKSRDKPENRTAGSSYTFFMGGSTSGKAEEISKRITTTDLDEIDNMIIPCADMMCIWERYSYSAEFLMDGIKICEQKETTIPYIRKKMELYRCLLDVCYEWGKQELCRRIVAEIDDSNRKYQSVGIYVEIPEDLRSLLFSDEPKDTQFSLLLITPAMLIRWVEKH